METLDDIARATARPRRWLAALACALLLGQSLAVAHALDTDAHADERTCELCHVASELSGAAPTLAAATVDRPTGPLSAVVAGELTLPGDASLLPPSRAPPTYLAIP